LVVVWPKGVLVAAPGAHGDTTDCAWWPGWLGAIRLPQIDRSTPCRLDYGIMFPNVALIKELKRLTTILEA
jgi:hypothetical protein